MKRKLVIVLFLLVGIVAWAQKYPSEWMEYTSDGYFHDIESDVTKQVALDLAQSNLARQIKMRVNEVSKMDKQAVNGQSSILYSSSKTFSTDIDMKLVETKTHYNQALGKYFVLVYIDKAASTAFYEKELKMLISKVDNAITIADNYVSTGFKQKAKNELQKASRLLDDGSENFFWLNVFGVDEYRIQNYLNKANEREKNIKQKLADLEYSTTYCIVCDADIFDKKYAKLANEVKGNLSTSGCNFVDSPAVADFVIRIKATARKYNKFQGAYFTYIDAAVAIDKTSTKQRIFEDEVQVKGAHTLKYDEAARDGYKQIGKAITKLLKENIKP